MAAGEDPLLTSHDVIRLGADDHAVGPLSFPTGNGSQEAALSGSPEGTLSAPYLYGPGADTGVRVLHSIRGAGRKRWGVYLALGIWLGLRSSGAGRGARSRLMVTSIGSEGTFVEALDPRDGSFPSGE